MNKVSKFQKFLKLIGILLLTLLIPQAFAAAEQQQPTATSETQEAVTKKATKKNKNDDSITVDCAISIGKWCICAKQLKNNKLRQMSSPIDWMRTGSLDDVAHLFETKFSDFFKKIDVSEKKRNDGNRTVYDTKNDIKSIHYMPCKTPFKKAFPEFKQKMRQRARRLDKTLSNSKSVLLVNCREYPKKYGKNSTDNELKRFARRFSAAYPNLKKIYLIDVHQAKNEKIKKRIIFKNRKFEITQYKFNNIDYKKHKPPFGNDQAWKEILKNVKLSKKNDHKPITNKTKNTPSAL